ncbi:MAG: hypothetical protein WCH34_14145 [Bacteroidota bacterium]
MIDDWTIEWVMFFDEFASGFHPTFQKELAQQLFRKGSEGTGIKQFDKYNFQLIIGAKDPELRLDTNKVFAKIEFITPTSFTIPAEIYWTCDETDKLLEIHKHNVSDKKIEFNWADNFPIQSVLPHI